MLLLLRNLLLLPLLGPRVAATTALFAVATADVAVVAAAAIVAASAAATTTTLTGEKSMAPCKKNPTYFYLSSSSCANVIQCGEVKVPCKFK